MTIQNALEYQVLYNKLKDQNIPIKLAYKLNKLSSKIFTEITFYEDAMRKILMQYAEKDEEGNFKQNKEKTGILIQSEFIDICHKKISELQSIEFEIKDIKFTLEELEHLNITPSELYCLTPLIEE